MSLYQPEVTAAGDHLEPIEGTDTWSSTLEPVNQINFAEFCAPMSYSLLQLTLIKGVCAQVLSSRLSLVCQLGFFLKLS